MCSGHRRAPRKRLRVIALIVHVRAARYQQIGYVLRLLITTASRSHQKVMT